jgi:hypothetical protein
MRLWSIHPRYLDGRGLVALWREALLAQAVLLGRTKGYTRHPQLIRFHDSREPEAAIAFYLRAVRDEAECRGYRFDETRIGPGGGVEPLAITTGQLDYERDHLQRKLQLRNPVWLAGLGSLSSPQPHPLFFIVGGPVAEWEVRPDVRKPIPAPDR